MDIKINEVTPVNTPNTVPVKEKNIGDEFSFALKRLGDHDLMQRLNGLIDDITVAGKKIAKHMDIKDMKQYRSMISDFVNEVVTNSHKFTRENFLDRRGRHRVFRNVKIINQDLDDLAQELLKQEKDHISILDKVGEIEGLLLDMLI